MLAAKLTAQGRFEIFSVAAPSLSSPEEVLLRMSQVGICGSDLHYFRHGAIGDQIVEYPFTIGHEGVAIVQAVGPGVKGLRPGDKVVINPAISCGHCDECLVDRRHTCRHLKFLGCPEQLEGCLQEYIVMPAENCFPVSEEIFPLAAQVEPLAIALYAVQMAGPIQGKSMAVFGCGSIGLSLIFNCQLEKSKMIAAIDKVSARLEAALRFGAHWVGNADKQDIVLELTSNRFNSSKNSLGPGQFDLAFDCCGDQRAINQALSLLKPGGKLIIIGIPETNQVYFDPHLLRRKEITISNIRRQNNFFPRAIEFLQAHKDELKSLITHHFPLNEIQKSFEIASNYEDGVIKAVIDLPAIASPLAPP